MKKRKRMILFSAKEVLCVLLLFAQNEIMSAKSCSASIPTLQRVIECPKTHKEWMERSAIKRCNMLAGTSQCSSFTYHCLLNQDGNATFEVCAPTWYLSGFCAIYNTDEFRVVDNFSFDCNNNTKIKKEDRCPSRYLSTETYKYQICYRKREQTTLASERIHQSNMENRSDTSIWTIVFIVLFILALIASIIQGVFLYRVGCCKLRNKEEICKTNKPRQEDPSHDVHVTQGYTHQNQFQGDDLGIEQMPLLKETHQNPFEGGGGDIGDAHPLKESKTADGDHGKGTKGSEKVVPRQQNKPAINEKSTNAIPKAKNDHEKSRAEREEERKGLEGKQQVKKILGRLNQENQGKDTKGSDKVVPGQQNKPAINEGKTAAGDQGQDTKGSEKVLPGQQNKPAVNGASPDMESSAESNNLRSIGQNKVDNLGDVQKEEKEVNGKVKEKEIEQEHTESATVDMLRHSFPNNTALERNEVQQDEVNQSTSNDINKGNTALERNEMQQDEVNQSTSNDIKEGNTDSTKITSNNLSVEKCSSQE